MSATNTVFVGMSSEDVERIATALENTHGGSQITTFDTPESIAEHLEDRPPDCIVSEYEFSGMDGTEFLEIVRNGHPHLPFIFFTASGDDDVANSAFADRVTDYLPKDTADRQFERIAERISEMAKQSKVEKERKQQSSERKHKLSLFERVQEIASIGAWNYDVQADEGTLTEKVYDIYGVPRDESLSAEKSFSFYDEPDQSAIRDAFERAVTDGEPYDLNLSVTGADGTNRQVRAQGDPQIEDGTVISVQGTIQDVTEQADRQRELQLLQQSIDNADVPITLADPTQEDLPLVYINEAYEELTGYSADEALGSNCRFLQGEDSDPAKVATLREAIDNEEQVTVDICNYRKNGSKFWNQLTVTPIYDDRGQLVRYLGTQKDITTRKRRTGELKTEQRIMNQAINAMDDLFYILDEDGCFRRWNSRVTEVTGYTAAEFSDMHALNLFTPDGKPKVADGIERALNGQQVTVQAELRTVDGHDIPFEFNGSRLIDSDGTTTGLVGTGRDITERKERRKYLKLLDRVLRHNLRNDMNVIRGYAEVLRDQTMGETQTAAESIVQTSNALIDLAEKERELVELMQEQPEYKRIEVGELLNRIVQDMRDKYPSATIKITCPDAVTVRATTEFSRGIRELITNAVVHNDASSPEISVDVTAGEDESVIAVVDNGSKIPEMERELLTNGGKQTKLYHGSGLGLSLIRLLTTRAGGSIRFEEPATTGNKILLEIPNA